MLLQISTLKFWINLEPLDYFHLIGRARGAKSIRAAKKSERNLPEWVKVSSL